MQLTCISDTHGRHDQLTLEPGDVLLFAGDWTGGSDIDFKETHDFLKWLSAQPFNHKIFIAGNHELQVEANPEQFREILLSYPDVIYLENSGVTIDGINFWGSPYSNEFFNWAFMEDEWDLAAIWSKIPDNTNVLITHGPAYGSHDLVKRSYGQDPHVGSKTLTERKKALKGTLKAHIVGHIHEGAGMSEFQYSTGSYYNINVSVLNEKYQLVNKPIILEI